MFAILYKPNIFCVLMNSLIKKKFKSSEFCLKYHTRCKHFTKNKTKQLFKNNYSTKYLLWKVITKKNNAIKTFVRTDFQLLFIFHISHSKSIRVNSNEVLPQNFPVISSRNPCDSNSKTNELLSNQLKWNCIISLEFNLISV